METPVQEDLDTLPARRAKENGSSSLFDSFICFV